MSERVTLRRVLGGFVALAVGAMPLLAAVPAHGAGPCGPPVVNPVACENTNPGTPEPTWDISGSGDSTIQGFATDIGVNKGDTVFFKINTPASAYTITIYRMGYYQGNGARQIATVTPSAHLPQSQPACLTQASIGLVDCGNWAVSASWAVPATAVSGIYFAKLVRTDTGGASHIVFVVRDDSSSSDLLFQTSDTTWQAYNQWGGYSLYQGNASASSDGRAFKVSYNRPFATRGQDPGFGTSNWVFYGEYPMVRFLEANGYDVSYTSEVDTDRRGSLLKNHRTFLSTGHDEYWSANQRANVEAARVAGVNLAFFSGNESFWKVRWENSIDGTGTPFRTLVSYKETKATTPIDPQDPPTWTGTWRDPTWSPPADGGRPENAMTGTIFMVNRGSAAITVPAAYSKLRFWRNTAVASLTSGQVTLGAQTLGYEWDEDLDNGARPSGEFDLSSTTLTVPELLQDYGNTYAQGSATHHLTLYRSSGGGLVFGAGTVQWSWGLDVNHDLFPDTGPSTPDPNMRQATVNILADMGAQPATLQSGLVAASPSTDITAPASLITSPASGASVAPGGSLTISGTAADSGGGVVAGVEVTVDSGASWHPATGTTSWSYTFKPSRPGTFQVRSRAVDDSGNVETPSAGITITVTGPTQPTFLAKSTIANNTQVAPPAGVVAGDLLLAELEIDSTTTSAVTGPPGWTKLQDVLAGASVGQPFHFQLWYKIATTHEPIQYVWNVPAGVYVDLGVSDYYNVNPTSPIDASSAVDSGATTKPSTGSITTTSAGDMLVAFFADANNVTWTAGSGMTKRFDYDGNESQDAIQAAVGPTGAKTVTNNDQFNGATAAMLVALKPLQTDTTPPVVTVTGPGARSTVSGTAVVLSASASDNVGVAWVQFQVDGANVGGRVTSPPYQVSWD
ncbi:MAG TPA: N,N-dimethylformamidase beta subunit family domain-containing protein, partial [Terriglobales bacterium]|nr:N,N-dimethylformamidase beta subunit family domain-containing protein [Terriglobales bacterium]